MIDATEKLVDDILADRVKINDLDMVQMEAVIDFMRESIGEMLETADDDEDEQYAEGLLALIDVIENVVGNRIEAEASGAWDDVIEASVARGNTYFEMENYVVQ